MQELQPGAFLCALLSENGSPNLQKAEGEAAEVHLERVPGGTEETHKP